MTSTMTSMNTRMEVRLHGYICAAIIATLLLIPFAEGAWAQAGAAGPVTDANIVERITTMKTAADHQAIATYYQGKAAEAAAKVKEHEEMLKAYGSKTMDRHCQSLLQTYRTQKADFESLAKEHSEMAAAAAK